MPKSKRDKKVSLTKTSKKGLVLKQKIIEDVKSCTEKFTSIYIFNYKNMRTVIMQDIRQQWKPSRFIFGKNKIISLGLGTTPENEAQDGLHKLSKCLKGQCAVFFTNSTKDEVMDWFKNFAVDCYARSGTKALRTVKLEAGPLDQFPHSIETYLRKCGMPTKLEKGVVTLVKDYEVCKKGAVLTPDQAKILELLEIKMANFKITCKACWIKGIGLELFVNETEADESEEGDDKDNEDMEEGET